MYVTVSIRQGPKFLLGWTMFESSETDSFASLLEKLRMEHGLTNEALAENQPACSLRESRDTVSVAVQLGFSVVQCCQLNGRFVQYVYPQEERRKDDSSSSRNAFVVRLSSAKEQRLPKKLLPENAVWNIVICGECLKPRCVYAQRMQYGTL